MEKHSERIHDIIDKGLLGNGLSDEEMCELYRVDPYSPDGYYLMWAGRELEMRLCNGKAEIHAQIGLNTTLCPNDCIFCSFAKCNAVRKEKFELPQEDVVHYAQVYQEEGANLILLLATATYSFKKAAEMVHAVREAIDPKMPLLVNLDDMTYEQALMLKEAGADGAYHAVRMREGTDTGIPVEKRLQTFENLRRAHMSIQTCVEPVGPEHSAEELTRASRICMESGANSAGVGRRVAVPGTRIASRGMIDDITNARNVAVYRLAAGSAPMLNCAGATALSAAAGANLSWAEVGANPRDTTRRTEVGGRGESIDRCRRMFQAGGYEVLDGFSQGWQIA